MASPRTLARIEAWVWVLIYGGLLTLVLGLATGRTDTALGWLLGVTGAVVACAGAVLLWVRSRLKQDKP
ncbi:MAG: hypothetical protein AB7P37_16350 [Ramlibacter sp.]